MKLTETHTKTAVMHFSHDRLRDILANIVCDKAGFPLGTEGMMVTIRFEDEAKGSPAYKVGTCARVEVVLDLTQLPEAARATPHREGDND